MSKIYDVGIVGGGVSGVVIALELAKLGIGHVLFEKEASVVNGPPFCHLHAGGNLYPEISDEQCKLLMKQSIEMARMFPESIDERPTLISVPMSEKYNVDEIERRLHMLVNYYEKLIHDDSSNHILGEPSAYFKKYSKKELIDLSKSPTVDRPTTSDEWVINSIKLIDIDKLKTPVFLVQEYGWNLFRLGAQAQLALNNTAHCHLNMNTTVTEIIDVRKEELGYNWKIITDDKEYKVNYLVNSCGFKTGEFDEALNLITERLIEFKAAYVSKWKPIGGLIPELVFHGERGTPNGMVQLTPYSDDYYQIHGMTKDITLFENGLVESKMDEGQPEFNEGISQKLYGKWEEHEIDFRTKNAIGFVSKFVPSFDTAEVGGPPLFGAQQIPGVDPELRVGEVSFPSSFYARSEIIKASSALTVARQIVDKIQEEGIVRIDHKGVNKDDLLTTISKAEIDQLAKEFVVQRGYPEALSRLVIDRD